MYLEGEHITDTYITETDTTELEQGQLQIWTEHSHTEILT